MNEHCLVICGEWICGEKCVWEFTVDKHQMTRVVPLKEGVTLKELEETVVREFYGTGVDGKSAHLSYWPPDSKALATGISTPPVVIANEGGIGFFLRHLRIHPSMNLFVKFEDDGNAVNRSKIFTTPLPSQIKNTGGYASTAGSKTIPLAVDKDPGNGVKRSTIFTTPLPPQMKNTAGYASTAGSNTIPLAVDNDHVPREGGFMFELFKSDEEISEEAAEDTDWNVDSDMDSAPVVEDLDDIDLRPRGYDSEFWEPLLDDMDGGSNLPNIVGCDVDGGGEGFVVRCSSGSAFDHDVLVSGSLKSENLGGAASVGACSGGSGGHEKKKDPWMGDSGETSVDRETKVPVSWTGVYGHGSVDASVSTAGNVKRSIDSVEDEEVDIPPLYDDMDYETEDIPDLDIDELDDRIYVGKVFASKQDCRIALAIYAIKHQFQFKQGPTKRHYFVMSCVDTRCDWRVLAQEMLSCGYYVIGKSNLDHTCTIDSRQSYQKRASSSVLAALYKGKYADKSKGPNPLDLQQLILEDLRVSCSYMKCYRAAEMASESIWGNEEEAYLKLPEYLHMLKLANPGTVTDLKTEVDEDGLERFLYLFLAFGAAKEGFKKLRRVLVVDGTHLSGRYKGVLLTACGQDGNFQVFPLAYAVVDTEDEASWTWFFERVERIIADSPNLTIISDRAPSIYCAKKNIYPQAHHGACIVHLARNVVSRYKSKGLAKLVIKAGFAHRIGAYREIMGKIKAANVACCTYLEKIGVAHWSRAYFAGERYNMMTSNICEQLNKALKGGRGSPILELLVFIQKMTTRWFNARRVKSLKHKGRVTPEVGKVLTKNIAFCKGSKINPISPWVCEVVGKFGSKHVVHLKDKRCACKIYDKEKIPCGHALLAADSLQLDYSSVVGEWYRTKAWVDTYACEVYPEGNPTDVDIPEEIKAMVLKPPRTRRPPGRPKTERIPSIGEISGSQKKKKKATPNRCGRCKGTGHNRTNCTVPI